ncbi:MAG: NADH-quinone oxidoreductase subunit L [Rickettsiales bacterium]|nr:NADH-quinone oxidoreductase subunit L [Rickettsiales bacterium]
MYFLSVFLPLFSFIFCIVSNKRLSDIKVEFIVCSILLISSLMAVLSFFNISQIESSEIVILGDWLTSGGFYINWSLSFNRLSAIMVVVVNLVSLLVHIYSVGYMANDNNKIVFLGYLGLFTFFMLILVTSSNLIQLFLGWEGVGLTSYLLIGFWSYKDSANKAALKAFVVNRVGDFGFLLGIFTIFIVFGTVNFDEIFILVDTQKSTFFNFLGMEFNSLTLISILLFIGCMGKSAQFGLHTWLPDAMEGPTPVSALIHAATMVTAGVFLLVLMSPLIEKSDFAQNFIMIIGSLTSLFAASVALAQDDIKKIIAYSTCSQLGYMFIAIGSSAYGIAMFHLVTHAFFKALLFLGAGSVIHSMSDEQNIKKMGGLYSKIPVTYFLMLIGTLSLVGFPFFSAYYSKDLILEVLYLDNSLFKSYAYIIATIVVFLTSFYSFRLLICVFHGKNNSDEKVLAHVHESPNIMILPLIVLSFFSIFSGLIFHDYFFGVDSILFWKDTIYNISQTETPVLVNDLPFYIKKLPLLMMLLGLIFAILLYSFLKNVRLFLKKNLRFFYLFLKNKWYIDEIYKFLIISPINNLGRGFWKSIDEEFIDNIGPNGISKVVKRLGFLISSLQTGYLYHYALTVIIGLTIFISIYFYVI